ncbi:MAG TPA: L,D-transpeptidase [Longimicrobiales bacterium]|nr:L,D-transpeptidase [Longimicrobiales bacterium]
MSLTVGGALLALVTASSAWYALEGARAVPAEATSAAAADIRIVVDVSTRRLYVKQGDETIRSYAVAVGKARYPTPKGRFRISHLVWNPRWDPPDAGWARHERAQRPGWNNKMGRVKMFFLEPDYFIHGTPFEGSLGEARSHGCIRMANGDAIELAALVMKHGGSPRPRSWFSRIVDHVRETENVYLERPVPVLIRS